MSVRTSFFLSFYHEKIIINMFVTIGKSLKGYQMSEQTLTKNKHEILPQSIYT